MRSQTGVPPKPDWVVSLFDMRTDKIYSTFALLAAFSAAYAQPSLESLAQSVKFRNIGPAITGGRVIDIESSALQPNLILVAGSAGGLWRSVNGGVTFSPVFEKYGTVSIGDVAIAPGDPKIVWVGTGENNNQRSAHWGDGVYKSEDGGVTFQNMGLKNSFHIGRIAIDPKNPNVVFVASMGAMWTPGGDKGVYKTVDGGKTWTQVLKGSNDTTGFIDVAIDPKRPSTIFAAAMDRIRRPWNYRDYGAGSAIYKSTDAGKSWKRLSGGLPTHDKVGRIGIAIFPGNSKIVYATIDIPSAPEGGQAGTAILKSEDGGEKWTKMNSGRVQGNYYYGQIRVDPKNSQRVYVLGTNLTRSDDGGKTFKNVATSAHVDWHAMWIDPNFPDRVLCGSDGGFHISYDACDTVDFVNTLPILQVYDIGADMSTPYNVYCGAQDNGVWGGPSRSKDPGGVRNKDWKSLYGGDGMYCVPDPDDPNTLYTEAQFASMSRVDVRTRRSVSIRPREQGLRFNWNTPIVISPHNSKILYTGAQKVFRSVNRGDSWTAISGDLSTNDSDKLKGNVPHCTIVSLAESPVKAGTVWAGTDDGNVWVTQDGGANWSQVNANIPDAPKNWWVSRIEPSHFAAGTAYVTITGYRENDFRPLVYKTTDFGKTFVSIAGNLPNEPVAVIREDNLNQNLLVVGTELGAYLTLDGGKTWAKFTNGVPTVPVQDAIIHPRDGDLILGTHGRGILIGSIAPFRQLDADTLSKDLYLFRPNPALIFDPISDSIGFEGDRKFGGPNPDPCVIAYYLKQDAADDPKIEILDAAGTVIRTLTGPKTAGVNSVVWNVRAQAANGRPAPAAPGTYGVRLTVGTRVLSTTLQVQEWRD